MDQLVRLVLPNLVPTHSAYLSSAFSEKCSCEFKEFTDILWELVSTTKPAVGNRNLVILTQLNKDYFVSTETELSGKVTKTAAW